MDITTTVQQRTTAHENNENADNRTGHTGRFRRGIFDETQSLPPRKSPEAPAGGSDAPTRRVYPFLFRARSVEHVVDAVHLHVRFCAPSDGVRQSVGFQEQGEAVMLISLDQSGAEPERLHRLGDIQ